MYFCVTKRRAQGGGATSEHVVYQKVAFVPYGETIALFTDEKRRKSHQRKAPRSPLQTASHPVELAAGSNARQVCAIDNKSKSFYPFLRTSSALPRLRIYHARKPSRFVHALPTPAERGLTHMRSMCVGAAFPKRWEKALNVTDVLDIIKTGRPQSSCLSLFYCVSEIKHQALPD